MYRTLLATCGSEEKEICISNELKHMKNRCVTRCKQRAIHCAFNEDELRTHTLSKQGAVLSRYS